MMGIGQTSVTFTDRAARKAREFIAKEGGGDLAVRIRVVSGGCSGLAYEMQLEPAVAGPGDELFETNGVKVLLDAGSRRFVAGSTVDWQEAALGTGGFKVHNPNATGACGCGESFSVGGGPGGAGERFSV
ncbi:MAG TPA: iron-sulfur cluster assembly accessory protein [Thermodesulfobacteriota bacterium]|nr:iron-sulfur cluster assembly accessory protein [Thermodesulfobacteriota bacterium]